MNACENKPNLFVPGAGKSGTSSLHHYLDQHPAITMSKIKEPHFFCQDTYNSHWEQYLDLFDQNNILKYRGESSTGYMVFPDVIKRIRHHTSEPKFIFILRNPIDRIYSHYNWLWSEGFENNSFRNAVKNDQNQEPVFGNMAGIGYKYYFQCGCYGKWLKNYYRVFNSKSILILTTESLFKNNIAVMNRCFQFLGLPNYQISTPKMLNQTLLLKNPDVYNVLRYGSILNMPVIGALYYHLLPQFLRENLKKARHGFANMYKKRKGHRYSPISNTDRNWLRIKYDEDVNLLKQLTGKLFSEWNDFI